MSGLLLGGSVRNKGGKITIVPRWGEMERDNQNADDVVAFGK